MFFRLCGRCAEGKSEPQMLRTALDSQEGKERREDVGRDLSKNDVQLRGKTEEEEEERPRQSSLLPPFCI